MAGLNPAERCERRQPSVRDARGLHSTTLSSPPRSGMIFNRPVPCAPSHENGAEALARMDRSKGVIPACGVAVRRAPLLFLLQLPTGHPWLLPDEAPDSLGISLRQWPLRRRLGPQCTCVLGTTEEVGFFFALALRPEVFRGPRMTQGRRAGGPSWAAPSAAERGLSEPQPSGTGFPDHCQAVCVCEREGGERFLP